MELDKCQLLCHNCHMDKSIEQTGRQRARHGSLVMYSHGCRCIMCKKAQGIYMKAYKARQPILKRKCGTIGNYTLDCRCIKCKDARALRYKRTGN